MIQKGSVIMTKQHTETMQSPLHKAVLGTSSDADAGICMREYKFRGHLNLRGNPASSAFLSAVETVLGLDLPLSPCSSVRNDMTTIYWLGPNEWLLLVAKGSESKVEAELRAALVGQHIAVVDISSAQTLVNLSGTNLLKLLQKSTVYDCDPTHLPMGKVVQTTFAKTSATLCRCEDGSIDLVIRRSFTDYFMLWLQDASAEYRFAVVDA
jgi:sarcosine oxidase subunit gamma